LLALNPTTIPSESGQARREHWPSRSTGRLRPWPARGTSLPAPNRPFS